MKGERNVARVSIVIPVYNVKPYLTQCLNSVLCQSHKDWEAILVDDGSFDGSERICQEYAENDSRFVVVHQENAGAANAKNHGLDLVSGDYVAFLDSDDYVEPDWLEKLVKAAEESHADIVECLFAKEYVDHVIPAKYEKEKAKEFSAQEYLAEYLFDWSSSLFWNKLFAHRVVKNVRFRRERRCIDDEFFTYKAISSAMHIVRIDDILYHYRQRASSAVTSEKNRKQITDDALEVLVERYALVSERFPELRKVYLRHDVDILFYFARDFLFTSETVRKFRRIRGYYIRECLLHYPGRMTLINAFQMLRFSEKQLKSNQGSLEKPENVKYFP